MSIWTRTSAAFSAFWRTFTDPEAQIRQIGMEDWNAEYAQGWAYYRSKMFSKRDGVDWTLYLAARELYKHTRLIYNPVPAIVDFYVDNIWQPATHEEFESLATPASDKTKKPLIRAIAQLDQWGSFRSEAQKIKRYAAATGNVLVEGIDDLERGKILHKTIWPGYVTELELNDTGDVQSYTLEYNVHLSVTSKFRFKKVVTKEKTSYFRDGNPFTPPGKPGPTEDNYGFCFAVWIKHTDDGANNGLPAVKDYNKVDNLNSLASHMDDYIHKAIESPKIILGGGTILPIVGAAQSSSNSDIEPEDPRQNWIVFQGKDPGTVHDLSGVLKLADASPELKRQLDSFQSDYPELQAAAIIRENSQLSGAALERMLTPAQNRLDGVQANYNQQLIKLRQMQIAVAGMRAREDWDNLSDQQQAFLPYSLDSFEAGELNFSLKRSLLVHNTEAENEELLKLKAERAVALGSVVDPREQLSIAGFSEEKADEILQRKTEQPPSVVPIGPPENRQLGPIN